MTEQIEKTMKQMTGLKKLVFLSLLFFSISLILGIIVDCNDSLRFLNVILVLVAFVSGLGFLACSGTWLSLVISEIVINETKNS